MHAVISYYFATFNENNSVEMPPERGPSSPPVKEPPINEPPINEPFGIPKSKQPPLI